MSEPQKSNEKSFFASVRETFNDIAVPKISRAYSELCDAAHDAVIYCKNAASKCKKKASSKPVEEAAAHLKEAAEEAGSGLKKAAQEGSEWVQETSHSAWQGAKSTGERLERLGHRIGSSISSASSKVIHLFRSNKKKDSSE